MVTAHATFYPDIQDVYIHNNKPKVRNKPVLKPQGPFVQVVLPT